MAGKGGGAWKVAYADFVTAMMAFFLVMWIVAQSKAVKEAVGGYFRDPWGTGDSPQGTGVLPGTDTVAPSPIPSNPKGGPVPVRFKSDRTIVKGRTPDDAKDKKPGSGRRPRIGYHPQDGAIGGVIHFSSADASMQPSEAKLLKDLALRYVGKPNKIEVRGHAARGGDQADVWQLSYARCRAVMELLIANGIEPDRIRLSQAGANEPAASAAHSDWRSKNSRVEVYSLDEYADEIESEASHAQGDHENEIGSPSHAATEPEHPAEPEHASTEPEHDGHDHSTAEEKHEPAAEKAEHDHKEAAHPAEPAR